MQVILPAVITGLVTVAVALLTQWVGTRRDQGPRKRVEAIRAAEETLALARTEGEKAAIMRHIGEEVKGLSAYLDVQDMRRARTTVERITIAFLWGIWAMTGAFTVLAFRPLPRPSHFPIWILLVVLAGEILVNTYITVHAAKLLRSIRKRRELAFAEKKKTPSPDPGREGLQVAGD